MKRVHLQLSHLLVVKWAAVTLYVIAYILVCYTSSRVSRSTGFYDEVGLLLALRTTIITALFCTTMWSLSVVLHLVRGSRK